MSLSWYVNRLKVMSPMEIGHRFKAFAYQGWEYLTHAKKNARPYQYGPMQNFIFDKKDLDYLRDYYAQHLNLSEALLTKADQVLAHRIDFFNQEDVALGPEVDWHRDYVKNISFEKVYYTWVASRNPSAFGNIKYTWEINRFQWLYPLAQAYTITREPKYADEIVSQITHWIKENPYLTGVNWTSALELAIRLIAWGWALKTLELLNYPLSDNAKREISRSVYLQTDYIYHHLSAHSSANNHLTGEAAGLVVAGLLFDFGTVSDKWWRTGFDIILKLLQEQLHPSGFTKEQTFSYHCFKFDLFLIPMLLMRKNGIYIPDVAWQSLRRMAQVLTLLMDQKGQIPNIGDSDDGEVVSINHQAEPNKISSILNTVALLFRDGKMKGLAGSLLDEKTLWLASSNVIEQYDNLQPIDASLYSSFIADAGYFIAREKDSYALMDVGSIGYLSIAAHGHADALSVVFHHRGRPLLIDPGTYSYNNQTPWRQYFRSTAAHNTVMIDNHNQSLSGGSFIWLQKAKTTVEEVDIQSDFQYIRAWHDGYLQQGLGVKHSREFIAVPELGFIAIDRLENNKPLKSHRYVLNWHLHPSCSLENQTSPLTITSEDSTFDLHVFSDCVDTEVLYTIGSELPLTGWYAQSFDHIAPTYTVQAVAQSHETVQFMTVMLSSELKVDVQYSQHELSLTRDIMSCVLNLQEPLNSESNRQTLLGLIQHERQDSMAELVHTV